MEAQVAGMDTYYRYGDTPVPHHIDFISRGLWPETVAMNKAGFNNGMDAAHPYPWLCSNGYAYLNSLAMNVPLSAAVPVETTAVDYTGGGVYSRLPDALKGAIAQKRIFAPQRYQSSGALTSDNAYGWQDMGKLWLPDEMEVTGCKLLSTTGWTSGGFVQYPLFAQTMRRVKDLAGERNSWWTCSASGGTATDFVRVSRYGEISTINASGSYGVPVCFRITGGDA